MELGLCLRGWQPSDLDAALAVLKRTHEADAYPVMWPEEPARFARPSDVVASWVAESGDGTFLGHVCIRPPHGPPLAIWEAGTGRPASALGVVSRLYVAPTARRHGVGALLLSAAVSFIREQGLLAVLDVLLRYDAAIRLYEKAGWTRLGAFMWPMPDGTEEPSHAYGLLA